MEGQRQVGRQRVNNPQVPRLSLALGTYSTQYIDSTYVPKQYLLRYLVSTYIYVWAQCVVTYTSCPSYMFLLMNIFSICSECLLRPCSRWSGSVRDVMKRFASHNIWRSLAIGCHYRRSISVPIVGRQLLNLRNIYFEYLSAREYPVCICTVFLDLLTTYSTYVGRHRTTVYIWYFWSNTPTTLPTTTTTPLLLTTTTTTTMYYCYLVLVLVLTTTTTTTTTMPLCQR